MAPYRAKLALALELFTFDVQLKVYDPNGIGDNWKHEGNSRYRKGKPYGKVDLWPIVRGLICKSFVLKIHKKVIILFFICYVRKT